MKNVLMVVGSLRRGSFNRQLAREVASIMEGRAQVARLAWADVPVFNQDAETPVPLPVRHVRQEVRSCDGLWFCTPEYNQALPGPLKNLLDWLSRPEDPVDPTSQVVIHGKVAALSGVGGKLATAGARTRLRSLLEYLKVQVVGGAGVGLALSDDAWTSGKLSLGDADRTRLAAQAHAFLDCL